MYAQLFCGANYLMYLSIVIKAREMFLESLQNPPPPSPRIANLEENDAKT